MSGNSGVPTAYIISKVALSLLRAAVFTTMLIQDMCKCVYFLSRGAKPPFGGPKVFCISEIYVKLCCGELAESSRSKIMSNHRKIVVSLKEKAE